MNINIKVIPNSSQRYPTVGDWWFTEKGELEIRVSDLGNWKMAALVTVHELIEVVLCQARGISQEEVDKFDKVFEQQRKLNDFSEPGDSSAAPYRREHFFATTIERLLCAELGLDWKEYEERINNL